MSDDTASLPIAETDALDRACEFMHDAYERAAIDAGWQTQPRSRVPWAEVPAANKATMRAAVAALLGHIEEYEGKVPGHFAHTFSPGEEVRRG